MKSAQNYAIAATLAKQLNDKNAKFLCMISKKPDGYIDVYFNNAPVSGPGLDAYIDEMKDALKKLQETIKEYETKTRYNG